MSLESTDSVLEAMGNQALIAGSYLSPEAVVQKIDTVATADVVNVSDEGENLAT